MNEKESVICHVLGSSDNLLAEEFYIFTSSKVYVFKSFVEFFIRFNKIMKNSASISRRCVLRSEYDQIDDWKREVFVHLSKYHYEDSVPESFDPNRCTAVWIVKTYN